MPEGSACGAADWWIPPPTSRGSPDADANPIRWTIHVSDNLDGLAVDAAPDASTGCESCEPKITADRIYLVRNSETGITSIDIGAGALATARCEEGDLLLGGGCWVYKMGATHAQEMENGQWKLVAAGPRPGVGTDVALDNVYQCIYSASNVAIVTATAICLRRAK